MDLNEKKVETEQEKFEHAMQLETELSKSRHLFARLERERNAILYGTNILRTQKQRVVKVVKNELDNINIDLAIATQPSKQKTDADILRKLNDLLTDHDFYDGEVERNKKYMREINGTITQVEKMVVDQRSRQITDRHLQERYIAGVHTVEALEHKLDVQNLKLGKILTDNRALREEINHLLFERKHFNLLWEKLMQKLMIGKRFMLDLIEQSTIAYDQREDWCLRVHQLCVYAQSILVMHMQEMQDMQGIKNDKQKLESFLKTKNQKRVMSQLYRKMMKKRREQYDQIRQQANDYNDLMMKIMEFTNQKEIKDVARMYMSTEEENVAIFINLIKLNCEMENLSHTLLDLEEGIDVQRKLAARRKDQQDGRIKKLEKKLEKLTEKEAALNEEFDDKDAKIIEVLKGIDLIFKICKCDKDPLMQLLGDKMKITPYNVVVFLNIAEKHLNHLMLVVYKHELSQPRKKMMSGALRFDVETSPFYSVEEMMLKTPCPLCVQKEEVTDVIDTLQTPYTRRDVSRKLKLWASKPNAQSNLHSVSACHLPESRQTLQKRYMN